MIVIDPHNPPRVALQIWHGATPEYTFVVKANGAPLDISGMTFGVEITELPNCETVSSLTTDSEPLLSIDDAANGVLKLAVPAWLSAKMRRTYLPKFRVWLSENGGQRPVVYGDLIGKTNV
jgi:hypothetical protein